MVEVKLVSSIFYAGRVLSLVDVIAKDKTYRTGMYRSTGSNVAGTGLWFPFCGVAGPGEISRTSSHTGWIIKGYIYSTELLFDDKGKELPNQPMFVRSNSSIRSRSDHADPELRWTCFHENPPFNLKEVSNHLQKIFEDNPSVYSASFNSPIELEDAQFINTWFIKGLMVRKNPPDMIKKIREEQLKTLATNLMFG